MCLGDAPKLLENNVSGQAVEAEPGVFLGPDGRGAAKLSLVLGAVMLRCGPTAATADAGCFEGGDRCGALDVGVANLANFARLRRHAERLRRGHDAHAYGRRGRVPGLGHDDTVPRERTAARTVVIGAPEGHDAVCATRPRVIGRHDGAWSSPWRHSAQKRRRCARREGLTRKNEMSRSGQACYDAGQPPQ